MADQHHRHMPAIIASARGLPCRGDAYCRAVFHPTGPKLPHLLSAAKLRDDHELAVHGVTWTDAGYTVVEVRGRRRRARIGANL